MELGDEGMSKSLKIFLLVIAIILFGIGAFFYIGFAGLPWKKISVGNETLKYLENKYGEEFKIEDRFFNFKDGSYNIAVHPVTDPSLSFHAGEGWGEYKYFDYYAEEIWTKQAEEDYKEIVHKIFPDLRHYRVSTVYGEGIEKVKKAPIPDYIESNAYIDVAVNLPFRFSESDAEFQRMYTLIQYVQKKGGNVNIFIAYEPRDNDTKDTKSTTYITLSNSEIKKIKTIDDIKKYYNNIE